MIEKLTVQNLDSCIEMALKLWPDTKKNELTSEFQKIIKHDRYAVFLFNPAKQGYAGFIQMSLRSDYVEGCLTSPVGYIEGIFVEKEFRRTGIAKKLLATGELWAKENGCTEIASDCELGNTISADFHKAAGFIEANRIICFAKKIVIE